MSDPGPIPAFLDRKPFVGSFTILNTFKNCEHRMYRQYIKKDLGAFVETPEMKWGNAVHSAFEHRLGGGKPLPPDMQQWEQFALPFDGIEVETEQQLGITREGQPTGFFDRDVWFRGKLDVVAISGDAAYLPDWKTGSSKYEDPFELATGAMLLHAKRPNLKKISGCYIWLKEGRMGKIYDVSDTAATWKEVNKRMAEIEACRAADRWEKRKSGLCGWCSVKDCENWRERT